MKTTAIILVAVISLCQSGWARYAPSHTFEELVAMSDLVVILEHVSTEPTEKKDVVRSGRGRLTKAKVLGTLKGTHAAEIITIHHFHYAQTPNAPNHVIFPDPETKGKMLKSGSRTMFIYPPWRYLAFLKRHEDGSYRPASQQYDSALSFQALMHPGFLSRYSESVQGSPGRAEEEKRPHREEKAAGGPTN